MSNLIRGRDYLAKFPDFKLIGRQNELRQIASVLLRKKSNSVMVIGPSGVGATAIILGLQALKDDPDAPFDIVSKRFYWIDTDELFSCGESAKINADFQAIIDKLWKQPDDVLVIKDTRNFIEASEKSGNGHFLNALTNAAQNDKVQIILEMRDEDLDYVLKAHSDLRENYTLIDVQEPKPSLLKEIIDSVCNGLESHHGIKIAESARTAAIELTQKYRTDHLREAQPARASTLLDRALSSYRIYAHSNPPHLIELQNQIQKFVGQNRIRLEEMLSQKTLEWSKRQDKFKSLYRELREGEIMINELENEIDTIKEAEAKKSDNSSDEIMVFKGASSFTSSGGFESESVSKKRQEIAKIQSLVNDLRMQFDEMAKGINDGLELTDILVTQEFSAISGIAVDKLNEDETDVLENLEASLKARIFGQDHILVDVANGIKVAKVDKSVGIDSEKPVASYLFMGPSGVGKTEVTKVLSESLGMPLLRFDMSEYMEKHAVSRLIGAPPGYEGFEAGGMLTNAMRKNRRYIILFDEMEKAHKDVFDIMLQIIDAGRLTDNIGRVADFSESIVIFTTNVGQKVFLDKDIAFADAIPLANLELEHEYRPEFLNRFNGRQNILCFNRLELPSIHKIIRREITKIDSAYAKRGLRVIFDDDQIKAFCLAHYDPKTGARGLPGFIQARLKPVIVNHVIRQPDAKGVFHILFDNSVKEFKVLFDEEMNT